MTWSLGSRRGRAAEPTQMGGFTCEGTAASTRGSTTARDQAPAARAASPPRPCSRRAVHSEVATCCRARSYSAVRAEARERREGNGSCRARADGTGPPTRRAVDRTGARLRSSAPSSRRVGAGARTDVAFAGKRPISAPGRSPRRHRGRARLRVNAMRRPVWMTRCRRGTRAARRTCNQGAVGRGSSSTPAGQ